MTNRILSFAFTESASLCDQLQFDLLSSERSVYRQSEDSPHLHGPQQRGGVYISSSNTISSHPFAHLGLNPGDFLKDSSIAYSATMQRGPFFEVGFTEWHDFINKVALFFFSATTHNAIMNRKFSELPLYPLLDLPVHGGVVTPGAVKRLWRDFSNLSTDNSDEDFANALRSTQKGSFSINTDIPLFLNFRQGVKYAAENNGIIVIDNQEIDA